MYKSLEDIIKKNKQNPNLNFDKIYTICQNSSSSFEDAVSELKLVNNKELDTYVSEQLKFFNESDFITKFNDSELKTSYLCKVKKIAILKDNSLITNRKYIFQSLNISFNRLLGKFPDKIFIISSNCFHEYFDNPVSSEILLNSFKSTDYQPANIYLNSIIEKAHSLQASDIHFEPVLPDGFKIRLRIQGNLITLIKHPDSSLFNRIIARVTVMCNMPASADSLCEGKFNFFYQNSNSDIRVSIIPGTAGKSLVMRIHSNTIRKINIKSLGINSQELCIIKNNFCKSSGMILFTGPTGSGKTTSLYACLENFCSKQKKIITVEDPVEYTLPWALQIPVDSDNNISMSQALKASLRHDPDVIVIGEIRDSKSAKLAVRFARTGHLVLATMHSLSAESALNRLTDFEINSKTIAEVLTLIINQRLIPKNSIKEEGENFVLRTGIFSIMEITDQNRYNIISDSNTIFEKSSLNILKNKADELIKNKICSSDIIKEIL